VPPMLAGRKTITQVLAHHKAWLLAVPGVFGAAIGTWEREPCIIVFVERETPEIRRRIPPSLGGFAVKIEATESPRERQWWA